MIIGVVIAFIVVVVLLASIVWLFWFSPVKVSSQPCCFFRVRLRSTNRDRPDTSAHRTEMMATTTLTTFTTTFSSTRVNTKLRAARRRLPLETAGLPTAQRVTARARVRLVDDHAHPGTVRGRKRLRGFTMTLCRGLESHLR